MAEPSIAELEAQLAARKAQDRSIAHAAVRAIVEDALATLPERKFSTGSTGRFFKGCIEGLNVKGYQVDILIVDRDTVVKPAKVAA